MIPTPFYAGRKREKKRKGRGGGRKKKPCLARLREVVEATVSCLFPTPARFLTGGDVEREGKKDPSRRILAIGAQLRRRFSGRVCLPAATGLWGRGRGKKGGEKERGGKKRMSVPCIM